MLLDHADRDAHPTGDLGMGEFVEDVKHESLATPRGEALDSADIGAKYLPGRQGIFGLQMLRCSRLVGFRDCIQVVVATNSGAPVFVDQQIPGDAIEQRAAIEDLPACVLHGQHTGIAFLRQVGGRVAVAHLAVQKVQQFAVVALQQGTPVVGPEGP